MAKNKNEQKNKKSEKNKSSLPITKLFFISAVLSGMSSYYVYKLITTPPPLPTLDQNEWWGPYPIDTEPDISIRPFKIEFSDVMVDDLKSRLLHHRAPPPPLEGAGFTYGFNSHMLTQVVDYWRNSYNFKQRERFMNQFDHFKTKIQGLDIHFLHVKPNAPEGVTMVPLMLLHGWPSSVREFYEVIPLLTTHREGDSFVFEVIAPSLPGFGYSEAASRPGLGPAQMAVILHKLMVRLGRPLYYVHGGDFGHAVGSAMATWYGDNVRGLHSNTPLAMFSRVATLYTVLGSIWPSLVMDQASADLVYPLGDKIAFLLEESGYLHLQATKPDTVGAALSDSPAGLAAYILEKFSTWTAPVARRASDGELLKSYSLTHLLDNVMVYWSSNCAATSARLYKETFTWSQIELRLDDIPTPVPFWGLQMTKDLLHQPPGALAKWPHTLAIRQMAGGHFPAMEAPQLLADDIREAVGRFRQFHGNDGITTKGQPPKPETVYDYTVKDIRGKDTKLDKYKGQVLLIVNVASQCGLTETNYGQLNELHEKYYQKGLRILAFPCNQFSGQEPGTAEDIISFTESKSVKFDLFQKVEVNGESADPLWKFLTRVQSGFMGDSIKWNFSKFVVDRNGVPVERMGPNVNPLDLEPVLIKYL